MTSYPKAHCPLNGDSLDERNQLMELPRVSTGQSVTVHISVSTGQSVTVYTSVSTGQSVIAHTTRLSIDNLKGPTISASLQKEQ